MLQNAVAVCFSLLLLGIVGYDAKLHFSQDLVDAKKSVRSAQRHWSLFYHQSNVYIDSSIRYQNDFVRLKTIVEPGSMVMTDLATSYYVAAQLPVYVPNIHRHHRRNDLPSWRRFLDNEHACYLNQEAHLEALSRFIKAKSLASNERVARWRYIIVNKDQENRNLRLDCLSQTRRAMINNILEFADIEYDGEYLRLYKLTD
ncbi:hypothetical protein [Arenicella xantha]|uniref:Uncharacterized protein n=1 Tax=Arenicella xantha TaxID=644221 RepID=A0A395JLB4_9GAMM|nr:hypothetical protein [Arenicella xantha]RBP51501.1 hypothetical protein DFR28_102931 [Arenicella xantha]